VGGAQATPIRADCPSDFGPQSKYGSAVATSDLVKIAKAA
jgi:hypothetical protein